MIREAKSSDFPELLRMGRGFSESLGIPLDDVSALDMAERLIDSDDAVLLIGDGVMAGALAYPLYFNKNVVIGQELFWWVDKDKRGNGVGRDILDALEQWAKSVGASQLTMLAMQDTSPDFVDQVYLHNGYKPFENAFVKAF